jgi:hypothetical protein
LPQYPFCIALYADAIKQEKSTMNTTDQSPKSTLHIFEQDGGWQWGITCDRPNGAGVKIVDYSDPGFSSGKEARADGERALASRMENATS